MAPRAPDGRPHPPATAVVQVAEDGTAKLYLGTELVEHAAGVDAPVVMRVLVDYAANIDASVRVTTQMPDGTWTRHWLHPDGTTAPFPRNLPRTVPSAYATIVKRPERRQRFSQWTQHRLRATSRGPVLAVIVVLAAALIVLTALLTK